MVLNVDCLSVTFQETEPTEEEVGIKQLSNQVVDKFHCNFLVQLLREKFWVLVFEYDLDFETDSQKQHWDQENVVRTYTVVSGVELIANTGEGNKNLTAVVEIQRKLI